ncbi:putative transcription factor NAM family [Helianthus annuus]|nr:putative transcription factor NAM family [Helianthus annuus]KAJ0599814.1 putative transcription factor NAM family [Helianthus annuus]KAJ0607286.1 putative transcription factor NAM family [Helianthus annuus]KAJ0767346.1 putative transcription factor NAM family [Helianthus annuus]KAJ0773189.1 putative transcription factor NAM family [Helianthus annuus]
MGVEEIELNKVMMNQQEEEMSSRKNKQGDEDEDDHENDMVMPGFRFHPTEEELVEFYLRRKVEGKRFNVELITFLDLYRYDPWELPALAAIGEKEWFFYVPRDRKYRNGDRPNRVTTSGYWKATGADRMIRTENFRSIGLKKTLVFYSGKAPKGIRTSWIMNEYRLPQHETERLQKAEISLCRVYKRPGVEDHPSVPRTLPTTRATSSRLSNADKRQHSNNLLSFHSIEGQSSNQNDDKLSETSGSSTTDIVGTNLGLSSTITPSYSNYLTSFPTISATLPPHTSSSVPPTNPSPGIFPNTVDDLQRIISYQQASVNNLASQAFHIQNYQHKLSNNMVLQPQIQPQLQQQQSLLALNNLAGEVQVNFPDRLWEWNPMPGEGSKDYTNPFK